MQTFFNGSINSPGLTGPLYYEITATFRSCLDEPGVRTESIGTAPSRKNDGQTLWRSGKNQS